MRAWAAFCLAFVPACCGAFEIDGLRDGASMEDAAAQLRKLGLAARADSESRLSAGSSGRRITLMFCKGALVTAQKDVDPSFDTFVELVAKYEESYGRPLEIEAHLPDPTQSDKVHGLWLYWRRGRELVTVFHNNFETNAQTSVVFEVRNACFSNSYLRDET